MRITILVCIIWVCFYNPVFSQENIVTIDLTAQKFIGNESELNRERFFSMHDSYTGSRLASRADYLFDNLGIEFGRAFSGPGPFHKSKDKARSLEQARKQAERSVGYYKNAPLFKKYNTRDLVITSHRSSGFQPQENYEAAAAYNAEFIKNGFPVMPKYYEVLNEPFVHAKDYVQKWSEVDSIVKEMAKLHKAVADKVHAEVPEIMVGGYTSAWPEVDFNNFKHWNTRMKMFMDIAGESVKFFSTHLYDGRNVTGDFNYRTGSNGEAILDLIEAYSYKKWGVVKPHIISEYGFTGKNLQGKPYSRELDATCLRSYNSLLMGFLDKPDRILKAIPFITGESHWFYSKDRKDNPDGNPYPWDMVRRLKDGSRKYTDLKKFYELWKGVQGKRVDVFSSNPDIQVHAFKKGKKAYIALNNIHSEELTVKLDFLNKSDSNIKNITLRQLYVATSGIAKLIFHTNLSVMNEITLKQGETVVLECDLSTNTEFKKKVVENNYYTKTYMQEIKANQKIRFIMDNVEISNSGRAALKMSLGRVHGLSKKPTVRINDIAIEVPDNWAGYDQTLRKTFFGMIAIPIDYKMVKPGKNTIECVFPDSGGFISSMILNVNFLKILRIIYNICAL